MPAVDRGGFFVRFRRKPRNKAGNNGCAAQQGHTVKKLDVSADVGHATAVQTRPDAGNIATQRDYWAEAAEYLRKTKPDDHKKLEATTREVSHAPGTLEEQIRQILSNSIATLTDRQWRIRCGTP